VATTVCCVPSGWMKVILAMRRNGSLAVLSEGTRQPDVAARSRGGHLAAEC
jgi:hypothetical protein